MGARSDPAAVFGRHQGEVRTFDDHAGAGTVVDDGGAAWSFHCTRIADGSRTIAVGAAVGFRVVPGPTGFEAVDVAPR